MRMTGLLSALVNGENATHHPDNSISDFILKELLAFEMKVKADKYCPPDSRWNTSEEFVADLDKLITTFSILRSNEDSTEIYNDTDIQKGLILFISMYRNLCFLEIPEEVKNEEK